MREIALAPLSLDDVTEFIADTLRCEHAHAEPLARLVYDKTLGNPFFAIQFLTALARGRAARLRSGRGRLDVGFGAHPRQRLYRQRGGPHGREAEAACRRRRRIDSSNLPVLGTRPRSPL